MEIKPFRAFRFNADVVGDVGNCIAPPYDVISEVQQQQLYEKSPYNIVHITKGKTAASDTENNNRYTRAAECLNSWIEKGVLKQDTKEAVYPYVQDFELAGIAFQRLGFIALSRLEEFGAQGQVKPHEYTLDEPKIDRLNLKRATLAEFGLVFMLYNDERNIADRIIENAAQQRALINFIDEQNVRHRLFAVTAKSDIKAISKMMLDKSCIIADGHHRYEAALSYYRETGNPAAQYQMTAFVNTQRKGLVILATHRLVDNLEKFDFKKSLDKLTQKFEVTEYRFDSPQTKTQAGRKMLTQMKDEQGRNKNAFGVFAGNGTLYVAVLKNSSLMDSAAPDMSAEWKSLDVSVLHKLILEGILSIDEKKLAEGANIEYVKDTGGKIDELVGKVESGQKQAVFFMNPPKMQQIQMVVEASERMPQKSTYFYPKMYTGLTINKL
jgi:uncharacterized protein (DUF1015 family)